MRSGAHARTDPLKWVDRVDLAGKPMEPLINVPFAGWTAGWTAVGPDGLPSTIVIALPVYRRAQ
jgi:hypothetical protein